jgi:DNA-binding transcriptional LysR family regulator
VKLIDEGNGRKTQPTLEGKKLYGYLDKIFKLLDKAEVELKRMEAGKQTNIIIGTTPTYGKFILPYIFENYASCQPQCHIKVTSESSISLLNSLKQDKVDIVVMALWKKLSLRNFQVHHLEHEEVILLSAPSHPLQKKKNIALKDLQHEKFITRDEQSGTRKYILKELRKRGVILTIDIECASPDLVKDLIMEGKGIGFLTRTKVHKELAQGSLQQVDLGRHKFYLDIAIVLSKHKSLKPEICDFVNCIIETKHHLKVVS